MSKQKKTAKKTIRLQMAERLEKAFADLRESLSKATFQRNIKKASKALTADLKAIRPKAVKLEPVKKKNNVTIKPEGRKIPLEE